MRVTQPPGSLAEVDPLDRSTWKEGSIPYNHNIVNVLFVPMGREKLALDGAFRPYWHDRKRAIWRRIQHGGWYALRRSLRHMEETHGKETPTLKRLNRICSDCAVDFIDLNKADFQINGRVDQASHVLRQNILRLGNIIDEHKVEGREEIYALFLIDFYGADGSTIHHRRITVRTETAARKFKARIKNIRAIDAWVSYYGMVVEAIILSLEDHLRSAIKFFQSYRRLQSEGRTRPANAAWGNYLYHLNYLQQRPFRRAWVHLWNEAQRIPLMQPGSEDTRVLLDTSFMSLVLLHIRSQLDRMKLHLSRMKDHLPVSPDIAAKMQKAISDAIKHLDDLHLDEISSSLRNTIAQVYPLLHQAKTQLWQGNPAEAWKTIDTILNLL